MTEAIDSPPAMEPGEGDGIYYDNPIPQRPIAGNTADDDGEAIDGFFEAPPHEAQVYGIPDTKVDKLPPTTRILSRTLPLEASVPLMFFAPDRRRKHLTIGVRGAVDVRFGSEKSDVYGAAPMIGGGEDGTGQTLVQLYDFPDHTGGVWLYSTSGSVDGGVCVWVTTE